MIYIIKKYDQEMDNAVCVTSIWVSKLVGF